MAAVLEVKLRTVNDRKSELRKVLLRLATNAATPPPPAANRGGGEGGSRAGASAGAWSRSAVKAQLPALLDRLPQLLERFKLIMHQQQRQRAKEAAAGGAPSQTQGGGGAGGKAGMATSAVSQSVSPRRSPRLAALPPQPQQPSPALSPSPYAPPSYQRGQRQRQQFKRVLRQAQQQQQQQKRDRKRKRHHQGQQPSVPPSSASASVKDSQGKLGGEEVGVGAVQEFGHLEEEKVGARGSSVNKGRSKRQQRENLLRREMLQRLSEGVSPGALLERQSASRSVLSRDHPSLQESTFRKHAPTLQAPSSSSFSTSSSVPPPIRIPDSMGPPAPSSSPTDAAGVTAQATGQAWSSISFTPSPSEPTPPPVGHATNSEAASESQTGKWKRGAFLDFLPS